MFAGGLMVFVWKYLVAPMGGVFAIYELLPAFAVALLVNVVVSLLTFAPSKEVQKTFDEVALLSKGEAGFRVRNDAREALTKAVVQD